MKELALWIGGFIVMAVFIWGAFWVAKHGSYALWYEDMVEETVREMVKPDALRGKG